MFPNWFLHTQNTLLMENNVAVNILDFEPNYKEA